jgi:tetratricopeptide (TPR) repeat protein
MKALPILALLLFTLPLAAQNESKPNQIDPESLTPNQKAFLNLPEERRTEFAKHLGEANRLFQQKRIFECIDVLSKASAIFPDSPELHNMRGSCYVELRNFDKALQEYEKAAALSKDNPSIQFNIGEVYFVTKQWQKSYDVFAGVLKQLPEAAASMARLVEFKQLLCLIRLDRAQEAAVLAEKYDYMDDSPFHYFANAALAYEKKDELKAEEWMAMASRIFNNPAILSSWQDTMIEFGYIKSFYGEGSENPAE